MRGAQEHGELGLEQTQSVDEEHLIMLKAPG